MVNGVLANETRKEAASAASFFARLSVLRDRPEWTEIARFHIPQAAFLLARAIGGA
jgi:hypothetical protein